MNKEDLENLPYPMFGTTVKEKKCLKEALQFITEEDQNYFLCLILQDDICSSVALKLKHKVEEAIGYHYTLSDLFELGDSRDDELHAELRRIWIRKLLAYKALL